MNRAFIVSGSFSRAAEQYDQHSMMQRSIADHLFNNIKQLDGIYSILDVGMGTGYLVGRLCERYHSVRIYGLDPAIGMLKKAQYKKLNFNPIRANASSLPFAGSSFDLLVSNVALQWIDDLEGALKEARRALKSGGRFYFSIFSNKTLIELRQIVAKAHKEKLDDEYAGYLPNEKYIKNSIKKSGFGSFKISKRIYKENYPNLISLLGWLKAIGANRYWPKEFYKGLAARSFINGLSRSYEDEFGKHGGIFATFEVFFVELIK